MVPRILTPLVVAGAVLASATGAGAQASTVPAPPTFQPRPCQPRPQVSSSAAGPDSSVGRYHLGKRPSIGSCRGGDRVW